MRVEEYLRRHGRPMHTPQMSCLPMQTQWSDSAIWPTGFRYKPDLKWCHLLYLWRSWAPYNTMESRSPESWGFAALCRSYIRKRGPLDNCFGFVDGTVRPISRPNEHQRIVYNGQKRVHALKFQSLSLPNGLIGNLFGPVGEFVIKR